MTRNDWKDLAALPHRVALAVLLAMLTLLFSGCSVGQRARLSPAECDKLLEPATRQTLNAQLPHLESQIQTIVEKYRLAEKDVAVYQQQEPDSTKVETSLRWEAGDRRYGLDFAEDQLISFVIAYQNDKPSVHDFLLCMGSPSSYFAWYGLGLGESGYGLTLRLLYSDQGAMVVTNRRTTFAQPSSAGDQHIPVDVERLPIDAVRFSPPGSVDELLGSYVQMDMQTDLQQEPGKSILAWYTQITKPWPKDVSKLEYSTLPYPEIHLQIQPSNP